MNDLLRDPSLILPHGAGMQLLEGPGRIVDGWLSFKVRRSADLVVYSSDGTAPPELGLEIMAQACGMAAVLNAESNASPAMRGVVGGIRGYEYGTAPLVNSHPLIARVKSDLVDGSVVVCDAELLQEDEKTPLQKARITIVFMEEDVK